MSTLQRLIAALASAKAERAAASRTFHRAIVSIRYAEWRIKRLQLRIRRRRAAMENR